MSKAMSKAAWAAMKAIQPAPPRLIMGGRYTGVTLAKQRDRVALGRKKLARHELSLGY